jgi:hypothetical protein
MEDKAEILKKVLARVKQEVARVIIGQDDVVDKALIAIFTGNHALIEGVPGVAKTLLVRTLAHVLGCDFARIQFTPDLMPTDITGTHVFNLERNLFSLVKGPVFTTFLLADEINPPRLNPLCSRPCRKGWSPLTGEPMSCHPTSRYLRPRIPLNTKGHILCLKHKKIVL